MPGSGRPSPDAIAHPWTAASIAAIVVLVAWFGLTAFHGQIDAKAVMIGVVAAAVVFLIFGLLISSYRSSRT